MKKLRNFLLLALPICLVLLLGLTFTHKLGEVAFATSKGGAIYVASGATVTMDGGTISNNQADYGGAVYVENKGVFNFNGGTIKNNTATYGSAIYVENGGSVIYRAGTISGTVFLDGTSVMAFLGVPSSPIEIRKSSYQDGQTVAIMRNVSATSASQFIKDSSLPAGYSFVLEGILIKVKIQNNTVLDITSPIDLELISYRDTINGNNYMSYRIDGRRTFELTLEDNFTPGKYKVALGASNTIYIYEYDEILYKIIPLVKAQGVSLEDNTTSYTFNYWSLNDNIFYSDILADVNDPTNWQYIETNSNTLECNCNGKYAITSYDDVEFDLHIGFVDMYNREGLERCNYLYDQNLYSSIQNCSHFKIDLYEMDYFEEALLIDNRVLFGSNLNAIKAGHPEQAYITFIVTLYEEPYIRGPRIDGEINYNVALRITNSNGDVLNTNVPKPELFGSLPLQEYNDIYGSIKIELFPLPFGYYTDQEIPSDNYVSQLFGHKDLASEDAPRDYIRIGTQGGGGLIGETESIIATWYYYAFAYGQDGYEYFQAKIYNYLENEELLSDLLAEYDELCNKDKIIVEDLSTSLTDYMLEPDVFGITGLAIDGSIEYTIPYYDFIIPNLSSFMTTFTGWLEHYQRSTGGEMLQSGYEDLLAYLRQGEYFPLDHSREDIGDDIYFISSQPLKEENDHDKVSIYHFLNTISNRTNDNYVRMHFELSGSWEDSIDQFLNDTLEAINNSAMYFDRPADITNNYYGLNDTNELINILNNYGWDNGTVFVVPAERLEDYVTLLNQGNIEYMYVYSFSNLFDVTSFVRWTDENSFDNVLYQAGHSSSGYSYLDSSVESNLFEEARYIIASNYSVSNMWTGSRSALINSMLIQLRLKDYDHLYGRRNKAGEKLGQVDFSRASYLHVYL